MVLDDIEIPRFSEFKSVVVDSAVRKNPAKWRERNKRRALSRKNARDAAARSSPPSWEVPQAEADGPEIKEKVTDEKVPNLKAAPPPDVPNVPPSEPPEEEEEMTGIRRKEGRTMPGGYYVRSPDEAHRQTMRAFNVRLSRPYQRPARQQEEELPPLESEEELDKGTSSLPSRAARLAAQRLRQSQEASHEQQKKRQEEEAERRREAERRVERRLLEEKIRKLREEQDAKEQARRDAEAKRLEEAKQAQAEQAAASRRKAEKEKLKADKEEAEKLRLRRQKDAEEDALLREERRKRRQQEEAARLQREELRRQEEEQRRQEREREQQKRREEKEAKRLEEERAREAERQAEVQRLAEELRRRVELDAKVETEEEVRRREEVEREERRKRAEQRRREIREKADRAKKAAAQGLPPSAAAAAAAQQLAMERAPAEVQVTVAVLGHQGSGKSTLVGALMLATGAINERDLVKRRKDLERFPCEELQREDGLRSPAGAELTLLDVPGGRRCLPQAVQAAAEADVALLVVSAKGRELEAALREASGTSALAEQLRVAKGLGARRLLVAVTKMEEASWAQDRFNDVAFALAPVLTNAGFKQASTIFVPVDGLSNQLDAGRKAAWHSGGSLLKCMDEAIQSCEDARRSGSLEVLLFESLSTATAKGLRVRGRVEQGLLQPGQRCNLAPFNGGAAVSVEVLQTATQQPVALQEAKGGQNVELQLNGQLPDWPSTAGATGHAWRGSVLHSDDGDCQVSEYIKAQMEVIEMPRPLTAGFKAVLHVHAATVEAEIEKILDAFDWSTGITTEKPKVVKAGQRLTVMLRLSREVPLSASSGSRLSMLMLRLEETTVAIGHVLEAK